MLILGSSSIYRADLLRKLGLEFSQISPDIDETKQENETPNALVYRLANLKAKKIATTNSGIIITSDQAAVIGNTILGKPHSKENAIKQLTKCSGKRVDFLTSICVLNTKDNTSQTIVDTFSVYFKQLTQSQIKNYIEIESPLNCAGSFKSEGLGIALFEKFEGEDPNSLIGLPLIKLIAMLENQGIAVL